MKFSVSMTRRERIGCLAYLALQLLFLPAALALLSDNLPEPLTEAQLNLVFFTVNFLAVAVICWRFLLENLLQAKQQIFRTLRYGVWGFGLYYLCSLVISLGIERIAPEFANINDSSVLALWAEYPAPMALCTVFLVPITEEVLYRGVVFRGLYERHPALGYVLSTVIFAMIHIVGYIGSYDFPTLLLCFLQYVPAGIFLGWAYVRSDTIWCPILIHMTVNQIGLVTLR